MDVTNLVLLIAVHDTFRIGTVRAKLSLVLEHDRMLYEEDGISLLLLVSFVVLIKVLFVFVTGWIVALLVLVSESIIDVL